MKRKALFLDRDGVINEDVGYVGSIERFTFKKGIFAFLRAAQDMGFRLVVVTNQSGVARGMYTEADHQKVMDHMNAAFRKEGIVIDLCLTCFYLKGASVAAYDRDSHWRKPNPGMTVEAAARLNIDLPNSAVIGDKDRDLEAGRAAGIQKCLLLSEEASKVPGAIQVRNFDEALKALTM